MAQKPQFIFDKLQFEAGLTAFKREKVYGWAETHYTDAQGQPCSFVTLLDDGRTMVDSGGIAFKSLDPAGNEIDKSTLVAHRADDSLAERSPSVFEAPNTLSTDKDLQDYLAMDVKNVYQLDLEADALAQLKPLLDKHKVLYMPFAYRASYEPDDAFLVGQDEHVFLVVGAINAFTWATLELQTELVDDDAGDEEAADAMDFNMF